MPLSFHHFLGQKVKITNATFCILKFRAKSDVAIIRKFVSLIKLPFLQSILAVTGIFLQNDRCKLIFSTRARLRSIKALKRLVGKILD